MNYKIQYMPGANKNKPDILRMEGCLSIPQIQAIKQEMEKELTGSRKKEEGRSLHLQLRAVAQLDLPFLQLLLALSKQFQQQQQSLIIDMELSPEMEKLLLVSGFENFVTANS